MNLLDKDEKGNLKHHIGTVFIESKAVITGNKPHFVQKLEYIDCLNEERKKEGKNLLKKEEEDFMLEKTVDLIMQDNAVFIRPDPYHMDYAFKADEILQQTIPKQKIKFLGVLDEEVRKAIKQRGELWRINVLPKTTEDMIKRITSSKVAIGSEKMYYYNMETGTRYITYDEFSRFGDLSKEELEKCLEEIRNYSGKRNRLYNPEVDFFMANEFNHDDFTRDKPLTEQYLELKQKFKNAVEQKFRQDNPQDIEWRNTMFSSLVGKKDQEITEEALLGLSPEFFMHIEWLPGARFENKHPIFDSIFEKDDETSKRCRQDIVKEFISVYQREFPKIKYLNIGRVIESVSGRPKMPGRRGVYIAEIKVPRKKKEIIKIIRLRSGA